MSSTAVPPNDMVILSLYCASIQHKNCLTKICAFRKRNGKFHKVKGNCGVFVRQLLGRILFTMDQLGICNRKCAESSITCAASGVLGERSKVIFPQIRKFGQQSYKNISILTVLQKPDAAK